jgi:hypothetical protein
MIRYATGVANENRMMGGAIVALLSDSCLHCCRWLATKCCLFSVINPHALLNFALSSVENVIPTTAHDRVKRGGNFTEGGNRKIVSEMNSEGDRVSNEFGGGLQVSELFLVVKS